MSKNIGKLKFLGDDLVAFMCPGCKELHMINVDLDIRPAWGFNGDPDLPTFTPSILVTGTVRLNDAEVARVLAGEVIEPVPRVCHSYVKAGQIQFLTDCTHALAGQALDLENIAQTDIKDVRPVAV